MTARDDLADLRAAWLDLKRSFVEALPPTVRGRLLLALGMLAAVELVIVVCWLLGVGT